MRGKKYLLTLLILMFLASMAKVSIPATSSPTVTFKVDPVITPGVSVDAPVMVNVSIEADPGAAVVAWAVDIKADPNVLTPGFYYEGEWWLVSTRYPGYFLRDWCDATGWDPAPGGFPTEETPASRNATTGEITGYTESILNWDDMLNQPGNGTDGTGILATFFFTSKSLTAWSLIEITKAYYYTSWSLPPQPLDEREAEIVINGHYNDPEHDVAVTDVSAPPEATVGDSVPINVSILNQGTSAETFNLNVSYDSTVFNTTSVSLASGASGMEPFTWNTTGLDPGNYNITAKAILATDLDPSNDERTTTIELKSLGGDVAVTNVVPAKNQVYPTWVVPLNISVTVLNNGTEPINCTVAAYYVNATAAYEIGTLPVNDLAASSEMNLTFSWTLTDVDWGLYTIKANATLLNVTDTNPGNNELVDGTVKVKMPGDVDGNAEVKGFDAALFAAAWWTVYGDPKYNQQCDFDGNGDVKGFDAALFASRWWQETDKYPPDP